MDAWMHETAFPVGAFRPIFKGKLAVSFREGNFLRYEKYPKSDPDHHHHHHHHHHLPTLMSIESSKRVVRPTVWPPIAYLPQKLLVGEGCFVFKPSICWSPLWSAYEKSHVFFFDLVDTLNNNLLNHEKPCFFFTWYPQQPCAYVLYGYLVKHPILM